MSWRAAMSPSLAALLVAAAAAVPIDPEGASGESTGVVEPANDEPAPDHFIAAASSDEGSGGAVVLTMLLLLLLAGVVLCCVVCHSSPSAAGATSEPPFTRLVEETATHVTTGHSQAPGSYAALAQAAKEEAQRATTTAAAAEGAQRFFAAEAEAELAAARAAAEALLSQPMFGRRSRCLTTDPDPDH